MTWRTYFLIGRAIWQLLQRRFPELGQVPTADIIAVVEELLTTRATVAQATVKTELPPTRGVMGAHVDPHYRLVITQEPRDGA